MAIRKAGLMNLMIVSERENLCIVGRTGLVTSMSIVGKINPVGFLDSTLIATIGLNHSMDYLLG